MTRTALAIAVAALGSMTVLGSMGNVAYAAVSGHCTYKGEKRALVDGAAWTLPEDPEEDHDWDDDGEPDETVGPDVEIGFASFKLDVGAIQRAEVRDDELQSQAFAADDKTAKLELTMSPDKVITQQFLWFAPGSSLSYSSNEVGTFKLKPPAKGRLAGTYHYADDDDPDGPACEITFDIQLLGTVAEAPPEPGQPLPQNGGEPGKVYLALNKAMLAGDLDALATLLPPADAADMQKMRATPEFADQLKMMQALTPHDVKLKGGRIDGDKAWVEFDATEGGTLRSGTAEMARVDGKWRLIKESTRDRDK
jgi:hypothetical protein